MNARNLFISLVLLIGIIFLSSSVTQAATYFVSITGGSDGYNGQSPTWVSGVIGPKLTIGNAIAAASSLDTISVDYGNGNLYNEAVVVGDGTASSPGSKKLTFASTGGTAPNVVSFTANNGLVSPYNTIVFTGPFKFTTGLTLQAGAVIGAGNITVGGTVTRYALSNITSSTVDAQLQYSGTVNFVYQTAGFTITTALEMPPASNTTTIGSLTTAGAGTVTLSESKTMSGVLTTAAALNLGGGTLTINGASVSHATGGIVSNGTLAFAMTGATTVATGAFAVPNVTASGAFTLTLTQSTATGNITASSGAIVAITAATTVANITNSGVGTVTASAATTIGNITNSSTGVVTATLATTVGAVTNSGATPAAVNLTAATTIASITNSNSGTVASAAAGAVAVSGNILQTGTGSITFASTAGVNVAGTTTNSPAIALTGGAATFAQTNLGLITFADGPHVFAGVVTNSPSFSGSTTTGITGQTTSVTNNGQIRFASTASNLTFTGGIVVGATSTIVNGGASGTGVSTITGNGQITFINTIGNILSPGGITNTTNWPNLTAVSGQGAITQTGNGSIIVTTPTTGTYGTAGVPIGPITNTSTSVNLSTNGDLNFGITGASGFFGSTITSSGGAGGLIVLGNMNVTLSGTVSNARTVLLVTGHIVFGSAATVGVVISVGGDISNSGASSIVINSYNNAAAENFAVAGNLVSSGSGAISIPLAAMTGTGTITLGGINITAGTINLSGAGAATRQITVNGTTTFSGGTLYLATSVARILQLGGLTNNFSTASTKTDFSSAVNVTMLIQATTIFGAQTINDAATTTIWYGALTVNNTNNNAVVPGVTFQGGDFRALKSVTFAGSKVSLNGATIFIGSQALASAGNFINTIGYTTTGNAFVSMNGNAAMAISGAGTFGNFEVDAAGQTATIAAGTGAFTGTFNLTAGTVTNAAAADNATDITFNNATPFPTIVKNAGSFLYIPTFTSKVNVYYIGLDQTSGKELPSNATKLNNLTVATTNGTAISGKGVVAINNLTPTVNGTINILPNQALLLKGSTVLAMNGAVIQLDGDIVNDAGGANALKFVSTTGTTVTGAGVLPDIIVDVKSFGNVISGSAGLATGLLGADYLRGGAGGNADLLPGNGGSITFNANGGTDTSSLSVTFAAANTTTKVHLGTGGGGAYAATSARITTATGGRLILGANLIQGTCLSNNAGGTVNVGSFTYSVQGTTGNIVDATSKTIGTGTLSFQMTATSTLAISTGAATIAANVNVTTLPVASAFTLSLTTNNLTISGNLSTSGAATLDIATGLTLTETGSSVILGSTAANNITGAGTLKLNATTPPLTFTFSNAPSITNLWISNDVNLVSGTPTGTGLTVTTLFTHTAGILNFGNMNLTFQTAFTRTAGTAAYQAVNGYMILDAVTVDQGSDGFSVPNLRVNTAGTVTLTSGASEGTVTATNAFDLTAGAFTTNGKFAVANLATVNYTAGTISAAPAYAGTITLVGLGSTAFPTNIWPATASLVTTLTINGTGTIALPGSRTVNTALNLTGGTLNVPTTFTLTVADGSLITVDAGLMSLTGTGAVVYGAGISVQYVPSAANYVSNGIELPATVVNLSFTRLGNTVNRTTTLGIAGPPITGNHAVTITGTLTIKNNLTTLLGAPITLNGDLIIATDVNALATVPLTTFGDALTLSGAANSRIIVPSTPVTGIPLSALTIAKSNSQRTVTLSGGNLDMSAGIVTFTRGLLVTDSVSYIWINAQVGVSGQGFVRNVAAGDLSHVVGNVRKTLKAGTIQTFGRNEIPVGSLLAYCPVAITVLNPGGNVSLGVNVIVTHNAISPTGIVGLPIVDGVSTGVDISRYAALSWSIKSDISLGNTAFDLELTDPSFTAYDDITKVRIIRRIGTIADITNEWSLQGLVADYDNFVVAGSPTVINHNSIGGIRTQGAIFTFGMKSNIVPPTIADVIIGKVGTAYAPNPYKLPLAGKFTGGVGTYTYLASSTNPVVATVVVVHSGTTDTLKVTSLTDGNTTITVKATDANNDFATASFNVRVQSTGVVPPLGLPKEFSLNQNYPNPFNPTTNIMFGVPQNSSVKIAIYDMLGREVATLVNTNYTPGYYTVPFNASKLASGMYIYRMTSQSLSGDQKMFTSTKKLMLLK
jgi:hypothetical protein